MGRSGYVVCWAMALMVAAAPLPFGSVDPLSASALQVALVALALFWMTSRARAGDTLLPWRDPFLICGAGLLACGLIQMIPLPPGLVSAASPAAAALRLSQTPPESASAWIPLSLYPYGTWRSCVRIVCWTLAAVMARHAAVDLGGRLIVAGGLIAGGLFQAAYGLLEFISGRQHIFAYQKKYFTDVATGTFISRNNYAGYLEMAIPLTLAAAILCLGRRRRPGGDAIPPLRRLAAATGRESFRALLLLMGAFLMATALLMSRSRMGIISIAFSLIVGGLALGLRGRSRRFAVASVATAALVALFASQIDILPVVERFGALQNEFGSGYGRLAVWTQALPMLAAYPVFGSGLGTWEMAFSPFRDDMTQIRVDFAHNDYLEFAAEAGLLGVLVLAGGAALLFRAGGRGRSTSPSQDEITLGAGVGLCSILLHSFTDFHLSIPADALAASVLGGLFLRPAGPALAGGPAGGPMRRRPAAVLAGCLVLVPLAVAAASPAMAQIRSEAVPTAREEMLDADAGPLVATAGSPDDDPCPDCRLEPYNATRYVNAASRARRRLLKDVEAILRMQAEGEDPDPSARVYLARRLDQALLLARRAIELAPAAARAHLEAGLLHFGRFALTGLPPEASEDFDRARRDFQTALSLQPWRAASHRKVARLMAPFWEQCDPEQRRFVEKTVRRAMVVDPWATDIRQAAGRMGI